MEAFLFDRAVLLCHDNSSRSLLLFIRILLTRVCIDFLLLQCCFFLGFGLFTSFIGFICLILLKMRARLLVRLMVVELTSILTGGGSMSLSIRFSFLSTNTGVLYWFRYGSWLYSEFLSAAAIWLTSAVCMLLLSVASWLVVEAGFYVLLFLGVVACFWVAFEREFPLALLSSFFARLKIE